MKFWVNRVNDWNHFKASFHIRVKFKLCGNGCEDGTQGLNNLVLATSTLISFMHYKSTIQTFINQNHTFYAEINKLPQISPNWRLSTAWRNLRFEFLIELIKNLIFKGMYERVKYILEKFVSQINFQKSQFIYRS